MMSMSNIIQCCEEYYENWIWQKCKENIESLYLFTIITVSYLLSLVYLLYILTTITYIISKWRNVVHAPMHKNKN